MFLPDMHSDSFNAFMPVVPLTSFLLADWQQHTQRVAFTLSDATMMGLSSNSWASQIFLTILL
ncbi:hypothetical protein DEV91_12441 [Phyllobacterium brassicacearum]|nr:hypothetical protein DEV91_12441 [Phyllobacterium brassicacearum]